MLLHADGRNQKTVVGNVVESRENSQLNSADGAFDEWRKKKITSRHVAIIFCIMTGTLNGTV